MAIVEMADIFHFIGNDFVRPFTIGNEIVKAGHVFDLRLKMNHSSTEVFALCLAMSQISGPPHRLQVRITNTNSNRQIDGHCTCKAGQGAKCKHITALLLKVERMTPAEVHNSTCTELPQQWGKKGSTSEVQELFHPVPVHQFCHLPKRNKRWRKWDEEVPENILLEVKEIIYKGITGKCMIREAERGRGTAAYLDKHELDSLDNYDFLDLLSDSETAFIFHGLNEEDNACGNDEQYVNNMVQEVRDFYFAYVSVSQEDVKRIFSLSVGQDNFHWRKERQIRITGSTAQKYRARMTAKTTWLSRCQNLILPKKPFRGNDDTKYGKESEGIALRLFAEGLPDHKIQTKLGFCINARMPCFGYSPDGIMDEKIVLEVKSLAIGKKLADEAFCEQLTKKPKYLEKKDSGVYVLKKNAFYTQIQFGMAVLNSSMGKLLLYYNSTSEGVIVIDVPRDDEFIAALVEHLKTAYYSHILPFLVLNRNELLVNK